MVYVYHRRQDTVDKNLVINQGEVQSLPHKSKINMEQKKIDMNKVTEKYALVLEHIAKAQNILTEELTPLLNDGASYESKVEKVADDFLGVAENVAKCVMVEAAMQVYEKKQ